jgi:GT2 family glycosyltransferase
MHQLTVLICTHNRAGLLERTLASLNATQRPDMPVQILVAANACTDDTVARLRDYQQRQAGQGWLPLRLIKVPTPGKSHALNHAIPEVDTELTAFVDDDHRVDERYLVAIERAARTWPDAGLYCGRILPDWDGREPAWVHDNGPYRIYPPPVPGFDLGDAPREVTLEMTFPGGGNLFLRTPWFARVGRFDTEMGPISHDLGGAEDLDWLLRAFRLGARLQYTPDVVQYHYVDISRLTLFYLMRKAYKRTASSVRIHPKKEGSGIPKYLYRKVAEYGFKACTALGQSRRRFYLVRTAAAVGEIQGHREFSHRGKTLDPPPDRDR